MSWLPRVLEHNHTFIYEYQLPMNYNYLKQIEGKSIHDFLDLRPDMAACIVWVPGPIIVGAGPSGLAVAACLKVRGVSSLILEKANCIASLWQHKTYDRLKLHLPKQFCELPFMLFPSDFPTYPSKQQFLSYLKSYVQRFRLEPEFNTTVVSAKFDKVSGFWRVRTVGLKVEENYEFVSKWLIVATGENAEEIVPNIKGMKEFKGDIVHTSMYKSGEKYRDKKVLVVGCGNSGMEVCLDLCNYDARPSVVVRESLHVLPQEMLGKSTFGLSMWLLKWFPVRLVDHFLLLITHLMVGNTSKLGLHRPKIGPLELKNKTGKTPVLDVGTLEKIRSGGIKVCPGIRRLTSHAVEFVDGRVGNFNAIILATGYRSNVPNWIKDNSLFSKKDGFPKKPFPEGWKGEKGLYCVGFTKRGLLGTSMEARKIAEDIEQQWKGEAHQFNAMITNCAQLVT